MAEFEAGADRYQVRSMCAADQWGLLEKLRPILPALSGMDHTLRSEGISLKQVTQSLVPLMSAPEDDMRCVFRMCLAACERYDGKIWQPILETPSFVALMRIVTEVVAANFSALFAMERPTFRPVAIDRPTFHPVHMPNGEDWLLRPVLRKLCKIESLYDRTLRIEHIAKMNDALDVEDENAARAQKAAEKK